MATNTYPEAPEVKSLAGVHAGGRTSSSMIEAPKTDKMRGQNIVCFAKDWDEDPTSNNHVMRLLSQDNRVLWINSISTRTPKLTAGSDLKKIRRKLAAFFRGPKKVTENLWVYTPIVLPFPYSRLATAINRWILKASLAVLRRKMGMGEFQLWTFLPNAVEYLGRLGESLVVYYCTDEWSKFTYVDGPKMAAMERALCERADVVFATAKSLQQRLAKLNPNTHLASHGVDYDMFAKALDDTMTVASEIASLPKPVIGFFGLIHEWVDLNLIATLAERHPEWSLVMIGKTSVDTSSLSRFSNVHFLGRKPYADLPGYCKGFAVGMIPFVINELTHNVNPIKLREYLSAGVPVVSTALPEVEFYRDWCVVAHDYDEFERGIVKALNEDSPRLRSLRSEPMKDETWEQKVAGLGAQVMPIKSDNVRREPGSPARMELTR